MSVAVIETAIGGINGTNRDFQTVTPYVPGSVVIFLNGLSLVKDYDEGWEELGGTKLRMKIAPFLGDALQIYYRPC